MADSFASELAATSEELTATTEEVASSSTHLAEAAGHVNEVVEEYTMQVASMEKRLQDLLQTIAAASDALSKHALTLNEQPSKFVIH